MKINIIKFNNVCAFSDRDLVSGIISKDARSRPPGACRGVEPRGPCSLGQKRTAVSDGLLGCMAHGPFLIPPLTSYYSLTPFVSVHHTTSSNFVNPSQNPPVRPSLVLSILFSSSCPGRKKLFCSSTNEGAAFANLSHPANDALP